MNSNLGPDDDRQDVSIMTTLNSKLDVRRLIPETRQHDRKDIQKKLKVMMTDKVIMTAKKEDKRFCSLI